MQASWAILFALMTIGGCSATQTVPRVEPAAQSQPSGADVFRSCRVVQSGTCTAHADTTSRRYLGAVEGEPLLCEGPDAEAYRLTWVRTFHNPVVARVQRRGPAVSWRALRYGGMGGYEVGPPEEDRSGVLTPAAWTRIVATVDSVSLWSVPDALASGEMVTGLDGATWLVEGRRGSRYVSVECWGTAGTTGGRIGAVGRALLQATDTLPTAREVY